jgi:hypothetical protein
MGRKKVSKKRSLLLRLMLVIYFIGDSLFKGGGRLG